MRPIVCSALAATALSVAAPAAAAADLSGFLGGFETTCSGTESFVRYMFSLGEKYTVTGDPGRQVRIPPGFRESIGTETVTDKGPYVEVSIPVSGTYRGPAVSRLYFELAHESERLRGCCCF